MADANFSRIIEYLFFCAQLSPFLNTSNRRVLQVPHTLEEEELFFNSFLDIKYVQTNMYMETPYDLSYS
jgi:hypothetical protein